MVETNGTGERMGLNQVADSSPTMNNLIGSDADSQRTIYTYVTGTSVVSIKYKDGILLAADMGVNMIGVHEENHVATGFGNHLSRPILQYLNKKITAKEMEQQYQ
ncbi:hypothetical protein DH2020_014285 [Rehmannia glutinosa]|uniref:Uncharacterized protein n=1 Tax=Rehmannia glutinosa TaxID=99300 RepID=A0ABR0WZY8_REHGL